MDIRTSLAAQGYGQARQNFDTNLRHTQLCYLRGCFGKAEAFGEVGKSSWSRQGGIQFLNAVVVTFS